jgi:hypothetical protein
MGDFQWLLLRHDGATKTIENLPYNLNQIVPCCESRSNFCRILAGFFDLLEPKGTDQLFIDNLCCPGESTPNHRGGSG